MCSNNWTSHEIRLKLQKSNVVVNSIYVSRTRFVKRSKWSHQCLMHRSKLISTSVCGKQVQLYKFPACNYSNRLTNVPYNIGFRKRKHNSTWHNTVVYTYVCTYNALLLFDYINEKLYNLYNNYSKYQLVINIRIIPFRFRYILIAVKRITRR